MRELEGAIPITVAPGYMGDPSAWCFWETEYPDDGCHGPFASKADAIAGVAQYALDCQCSVEVAHVLDDVPPWRGPS